MLKKLSFIISSTLQSLFKSEERFTIDSVIRNARKSQHLYDGMYHITEELLRISDGTVNGSSIVLTYTTPMTDGEGEEMHAFILFRRRLFYFHKIDDPEASPQKEFYKDYEAPILLQLEFITRKQYIVAVKENTIIQHLYSGIDIPDELIPGWDKLVKYASKELAHILPSKEEENKI